MYCAKTIKKKYAGHAKVIIHNGDATEGIHHRTIQLSAPMLDDHVQIHEEIMEAFLANVGFSVKNGDELHYVSGTETHTGYTEQRIARHFDALGAKFHDELKLNQFGKSIWFVHQWKYPGDGHTEGDGVRNGLRMMYFNSLKEGWRMPDVVIGSHFHKAVHMTYTQDWRTFHGLITPSFQMKTRFAQKVVAFQRNDIGVALVEVSPEGMIEIPRPLLMDEKIR